ncbi:MAG: thioredoxin domain-containing protein [Cyanobacteria bacterium P01_A01_bin.114]
MKATRSKIRLAGLTIMLCLSLLGCSNGANSPAEEADASPGNEPEVSEEALADARAEWDARQQHIASVLQEKTRAELIEGSPTKGSPEAEVVLFKFSDFQCPYCAVASADMKTFMDDREDVLYVYKHFPLNSIHPEATPAAKATWAAQQQDQFWLYHDGLFANQDRLGEDLYVELAEQIGLDVEQFDRDRNSDAAATAVEADLQLAQDLQLGGTPTFLMNDILIPGGAPLEFFEEAAVRIREYNAAQNAASDEQAQPSE